MEQNSEKIPWRMSLLVPVVAGMAVCHVVATAWIFASNLNFHESVSMLMTLGYVTVPNQATLPLLLCFKTAFFSAILYTLSLGAGLSVFFSALGWAFGTLLLKKRLGELIFFLCVAVLLLVVNSNGFSLYSTAFCSLVPGVAGLLAWRRASWVARAETRSPWPGVFFVAPVVVLGLLWSFQSSVNPFLDIRDSLLLSSRAGEKVNDFYYNYTIYAARTFKPWDKKIMRTVRLSGNEASPRVLRLKQKLINADYFPMAGFGFVDVEIFCGGPDAVLTSRNKTVLKVSISEFMKNPQKYLEEFSKRVDRYAWLRYITNISLNFGLPLMLYVVFFSIFTGLASLFLSQNKSAALTALVCFVFGLGIYVHLAGITARTQSEIPIDELLASDLFAMRITGLRIAYAQERDVYDHPSYKNMLKSPKMVERYWLAKALGMSRQPGAHKDLLALLDDPSPNVVCQALWSLGMRGDPRAIGCVLEVMNTSSHIYEQLYAHNALERLSWRQKQ